MSDLDTIAESVGTTTESQIEDDHDRLQSEEVDTGQTDTEDYEGGFTVDH
jgi:hypothetical protein